MSSFCNAKSYSHFFQLKISMYLPYIKVEILTSHKLTTLLIFEQQGHAWQITEYFMSLDIFWRRCRENLIFCMYMFKTTRWKFVQPWILLLSGDIYCGACLQQKMSLSQQKMSSWAQVTSLYLDQPAHWTVWSKPLLFTVFAIHK